MASTRKSSSNANNSNKKSKGASSFLSRAKGKSKIEITEEDLLKKTNILPEDVLHLKKATSKYLCAVEDNTYGIEFTRFRIRNIETDFTLFEINKPTPEEMAEILSHGPIDPDTQRFVRYNFQPEFLKMKNVGATVEFEVGGKPVNEFRMIERHYYRDRLLKSFDFNFGFCIPKSRNTCEQIYEFPTLDDKTIKEMVDNPYETKSDSFYFVNNELIMHNKAEYAYTA